jgi:Spy/CpxP family protein refolding chaperone
MSLRRSFATMAFAATLAFALAIPAVAQPPVAWWENPVANGVQLSDAQKERLNQIVREHRDRLMQKREESERAERELEAVFNADTVDFFRGRQAIDQLTKARTAFTQDLSMMTLKLRAVLTADQWRELQSRRPEGRGGRGRGPGPGGRNFDGRRPPPPPGSGFGSQMPPSRQP